MLTARVIPCLLLLDGALVKTVRFDNPSYIGDPMNAIHIYNELEVDELILLDVGATEQGRPPPFRLIEEVASECFMPVAYGGGIRNLGDAARLFASGLEKIVVNTFAHEDPSFLTRVAERFGSQAVVGSIDARREFDRHQAYVNGGRRGTGVGAAELARRFVEHGAGELIVTSIDNDGTMAGYDLDLICSITDAVSVPVIACGGAGKLADIRSAVKDAGAAAAAIGSMAVYFGRNRAVLINFPDRVDLERVLA